MALRQAGHRTINCLLRSNTFGSRAASLARGAVSKNAREPFASDFRLTKNSVVGRVCLWPRRWWSFDLVKSYSTSPSKSGKLYIEFTCKKCGTRNKKYMSKVAYNSGVVIITCEGCRNNHLIADNLNWFTDLNGKKNVEDILREKGETVRRVAFSEDGVSEIVSDTEKPMLDK